MDRERQKDFVRRVSQANRTELVAITYEIILDNIDNAEKYLAEPAVPEYRQELKMAEKLLGELMRSLDYTYPIAAQLLQLYEYIQRILVASEISGCDKGLASVRNVLEKLKAAFLEISAQDDSGSVMENAQQIYAGLTYGKGTLNESDMSSGANRGFLA